MKKIIIYLLLATSYFSFIQTSCEEDNYIKKEEELVHIELSNIDNSGKDMVIAGNSVPKEAYVIAVKCFSKMIEPESEIKYTNDEINFTREYYFINTEKEISIICNNNFNGAYPAGSDVTKLFIKTYRTNLDKLSYVLLLTQAPDAGIHSFKVVYKLIDSEDVIEADTQPIEFL